MKKLYCAAIIIMVSQVVFAEEQNFSISPFSNYSYLQFNEQKIHSPGLGVIFTEQNSLFIAAVYKQYFISEVKDGYEDLYHDIILLADKKIKRHLIFGVFASQAAAPVYDGLHTFTTGIGYGYEFMQSENSSLALGGGLVVADFGIKLPNGTVWPVLPLPVVRFSTKAQWLKFSADFQKSITIGYTILPESKVRLTGSSVMEPFDIRSARDISFDNTLWYRFFSKESKMGDFAGVGLGLRNSNFRFALSEREESYKVNYFSAYGIFDASFLRLSGGYSFEGREIYNGDRIEKIGNGLFISSFLGWRF